MNTRAKEFLDACRSSSTAAYERCKEVLASLDDPETRAGTRQLLADLNTTLGSLMGAEESLATFHLSLTSLTIGQQGRSGDILTLLQLPSVFAPEEWSRTFFEGLARFPAGELEDRTLAELGCGNGWISIALGRRRSAPEKIYGLDFNPRAITCARINLYLNALTPDGLLIRDGDGKSLLDRVEFHESDLLAWVRRESVEVDRVIGCIPQVLNPDLKAMEEISDAASDEFLVSLSNYTSRQGYLEDQFGLGLVARALEEAIEVMRPGGRVIFNLGGRPGRAILRRLFRRRGFAVRDLWTTKIHQAADTDIEPLAEIERHSPHRFEFFLGMHSDEPVSARTAQAYARAGGEIYHSLTVLDGRLRFPEPMRHVFQALRGDDWRQARGALDLDFAEDAVAEEKTAFLSRLADLLHERRSFPYEETAGIVFRAAPVKSVEKDALTDALPPIPGFRRNLAEFLRRYFAIPLDEKSLVALPNRASALRNLFSLYRPSLALVHPSLLRGTGIESDRGTEVLECPTRADLACKLIDALRPQLVATTLDELEVRTPDSFLRLAETTRRTGARLFVDISPFFELESTPKGNGVLQALAEAPLPMHVAILCGLVKNRVYEDLEVCFLLAENQDLLEAVTNAAEVTYSRVPLLTQEYYDLILAELLSFRLDAHGVAGQTKARSPRCEPEDGTAPWAPLATACKTAFEHPAITGEDLSRKERTDVEKIRFDYGENALASPSLVQTCLFEAFARREISAAEADPSPEIALFLRRRFGLGTVAGPRQTPRFTFGLGVAPLFAALAEACSKEQGTFFLPSGSYGEFAAAVDFFGAKRECVPTQSGNGFKMTPEDLDQALKQSGRSWLFLNAPVVNPTGGLYSADEISALLAVAARHRTRVVLDAIFSGLEFEETVPWELEAVLSNHSLDLVVLGGISKELAAGGLRFGFAWCRGEELGRALSRGVAARPHRTLLLAARNIFAGLNHPSPRTREELAEQRKILKRRAEELASVLTECGWEPLPSQGGLFLVARPADYLVGRRLRLETQEGEKIYDPLHGKNISDAMFWAVGLLINNSEWTGLEETEHCRFVFAVTEDEFQKGLQKVRAFRGMVLTTR
jgi:methionine S-methyltransferase